MYVNDDAHPFQTMVFARWMTAANASAVFGPTSMPYRVQHVMCVVPLSVLFAAVTQSQFFSFSAIVLSYRLFEWKLKTFQFRDNVSCFYALRCKYSLTVYTHNCRDCIDTTQYNIHTHAVKQKFQRGTSAGYCCVRVCWKMKLRSTMHYLEEHCLERHWTDEHGMGWCLSQGSGQRWLKSVDWPMCQSLEELRRKIITVNSFS